MGQAAESTDAGIPGVGTGGGWSADGGGVKARGSCAGLDEVAENPADLVGIRDDGQDLMGAATAATVSLPAACAS